MKTIGQLIERLPWLHKGAIYRVLCDLEICFLENRHAPADSLFYRRLLETWCGNKQLGQEVFKVAKSQIKDKIRFMKSVNNGSFKAIKR